MTRSQYLNIVRGFAIYDIIVLAPFAVPGLASFQLYLFSQIQAALNLPGAPITPFGSNELVFVNLLGIVGAAWGYWRLRHLTVDIGVFEGWLRIGFACALLYAAILSDGSSLLLIFGLVDVIAGPLHLLGYRLQSKS